MEAKGILGRRDAPTDEPYVHQPFPSMRYHRSGATQLVNDQSEHDALDGDPDWAETPAAFTEQATPAPATAKKTKAKKDEPQA